MNKPDFVQAAQNVIQTQPPAEEEFSTLSDKEKNKIQGMEKELLALKQQSSLTNMRAQDEQLKVKYADYNSGAIDIITADLLSGKVQATREHLYKAFNFDKAIKKAYDLGKTDKKLDNQEKVTSMSAEGTTAVGDEAVPKIEKGESDRNYFLRLASRRMAQKSDGGQIRK